MKNNPRMSRVNDEISKETSIIIREDLKDPRIDLITGITKVETTPDFKYCKLFISIYGSEQQKTEALAVLKNASGYIRKLLAERINLRFTPELKFVIDDSLDYSIRINKLLKEIVPDEAPEPVEETDK